MALITWDETSVTVDVGGTVTVDFAYGKELDYLHPITTTDSSVATISTSGNPSSFYGTATITGIAPGTVTSVPDTRDTQSTPLTITVTAPAPVEDDKFLNKRGLTHLWENIDDLKLDTDGTAYRTAAIPYGQCDSTSTSTVFTATVPGITELRDGVCMLLKNGVVNSAAGFTININNLGAKPVYNNMAAATRETTLFGINYTILFIYDSDRVEGGCWVYYRGYYSDANSVGYQIRTNSSTLPALQTGYRFRLWLTSADGQHYVPINTATGTSTTSTKALNTTTPIDPFGTIVYNSTNGTVEADANLPTGVQWTQFTLDMRYVKYPLTLTFPEPVYLQCTPQSTGGALINDIVQTLPTTEDGKIYIYLGTAYSATSMELKQNHPVYYYKDGAIRLWTADIAVPTKTSDLTNDGADGGSPYVTEADIAPAELGGEGNAIHIEGTTDCSAIDTQIGGNIEQDGTPTPSAPVPVQTVTGRQTVKAMGKNLIEPIMPSWTYHGVLCTNNGDGSFTLNGTATATATWRISQSSANGHDNMLNLNGTYTLSCSGLQNGVHLIVTQLNVWQTVGAMRGNDTPATFTTNLDNLIVYVAVTNGTTVNNVTIRPMLEVGNQASAYEPYKGQNYEINLGKNLFDKDNANVLDGYVSNSAIVATNNDYTIWIPCEPSATYTIQKMNASPQATTRFRVATTEAEPVLGGSIIQSTFWNAGDGSANNVHTITTASNSHYLVINIMQKSATTTLAQMLASIQIEKGSTASSYSAYFEPIELCGIPNTDYRDRIYKEDGKWWLEKQTGKAVLNGSEAWIARSGATAYAYAVPDMFDGNNTNGLSDHFRFIRGGASSGQSIECIASASTTNALSIFTNSSSMGTLANFKTWLASNNVTVYYVLATPTTTEITNEALVEELEALQDEAISVGLHNIYTDTPNALPTLTFDLTEYLSKSTTIIPETAVRLTLTDGGVINACGCRKDVQLTMRETIE